MTSTKTTSKPISKPISKPAKRATSKPAAVLTAATAVEAGKEAAEAVAKAGNNVAAAAAGYDQAVAMTKERVEKTSKAVFQGYGDFSSVGQENMDAVVQSGTIYAKGVETIGREVMSFAKAAVDNNVAATKAMFGAKSLREVVDLQNELTRKTFDRFLAEYGKLTEMSVKLATDASEPIQTRVKTTVEKAVKPVRA